MKKTALWVLLFSLLFLTACDKGNPSVKQEPSAPVCEHVWTEDFEVTETPTETASGLREKYCTLCGASQPQTIPLLSTEDYLVVYSHPDCEENGTKTYSSDEWGEYEVSVAPTGHRYAEEPDRCTANCTEDGYFYYACLNCSEEKEVYTPPLSHDFTFSRSEGPCTTVFVCSRCFTEKRVEKHDLNDGTHENGDCLSSEYGYTVYSCKTAGCGYQKQVTDTVLTHVYNKDTGICERCEHVCEHDFSRYVCTECGFSIEAELRKNTYYRYGDSVFFGHYPQSHVSDEKIKKELDESFGEATYRVKLSDGYYYSRATVKNQNRVHMTFSDGVSLSSLVSKEKVCYFRWDPIEWKILQTDGDKLVLVSEDILLTMPFQFEENCITEDLIVYVMGDDEQKSDVYANAWEKSNVRATLNETFLQDAFTLNERLLLSEYTVSQKETGYYTDKYQTEQTEQSDKIFLPSFADYYNKDDDVTAYDLTRAKKVSDYLLCENNTYEDGRFAFLLRSTGSSSVKICTICAEGNLEYDSSVWVSYGIAPCLCLSLTEKE